MKSASNMVAKVQDINQNWSWIWKIIAPQKIKGFIWSSMHGKILTNRQRASRGLTDVTTCPRCNDYTESLAHLFLECSWSKDIWSNFPFLQVYGLETHEDIQSWMTRCETRIFIIKTMVIIISDLFC